MKKIIILGNSLAVINAIEEIKAKESEYSITLIPLEECLVYDRSRFVDYIAQKIEIDDVLSKPKAFYKEKNVEVVQDKHVKRVNFRRKQVTTEEKEAFSFDELIIANTPEVKFPDIKGTNKEGVFGVMRLDDVKKIRETLNLVDTVVIQSDNMSAIELAQAIHERGREVFVITSNQEILSEFTPEPVQADAEETSKENTQEIDQESNDDPSDGENLGNGIRIIGDSKIVEVLGDSEVKAVKLANGKVLSAEMIVFAEATPSLKIFAGTPLQINSKIIVDQGFKTNIDHVYAVDEVCEGAPGESEYPGLLEQGAIVAGCITGQAVEAESSEASVSSSVEN